MDEGPPGIISSILRLLAFWKRRKSAAISRAADAQFTGSARGIADAFDIQQHAMVREFNEARDAISEAEAVIEDKRQRLAALNKEEEEVIVKRDGALARAEEAQEKGDQEALAQHTAAFERFDGRIEEIEATQQRLTTEIEEQTRVMNRYMLVLTRMQADIQRMPMQKAEAIADFVSATKIVELNDRLLGIQSSFERGPVSAVLENNKRLTAKARITERLAGTDVRLQDQEYEAAGRESTSKDRMAAMLAARKAEREGAEKQAEPEKQAERPTI